MHARAYTSSAFQDIMFDFLGVIFQSRAAPPPPPTRVCAAFYKRALECYSDNTRGGASIKQRDRE